MKFAQAVLLVLLVSCAIADDRYDRDISNRANQQRREERQFSINLEDGGRAVQITSTLKAPQGGKPGSRLRFNFATPGFPRFRARYFAKDESNAPTGFQYRVGVLGIAEYNATGNGFVAGTPVTKSWRFAGDGHSWSTLTVANLNVSGVPVKDFTTTNNNGPDGASATIHFGVSALLVRDAMRNRTLSPTSLKWDFTLSNWKFSFPSSRIAIILAIEANRASWNREAGNPAANDDSQQSASISGSVPIGGADDANRFGWVNEILNRTSLNDKPVPLVVSPIFPAQGNLVEFQQGIPSGSSGDDDRESNENRQLMAFAVEAGQASTIFWDPETSLDAASSSPASIAQVSFALIAMLGIFLALYF